MRPPLVKLLILLLLVCFTGFAYINQKNIWSKLNQHNLTKQYDFDSMLEVFKRKDQELTKEVLGLDLENMTEDQCVDVFYKVTSIPLQGLCRSLKRVGGIYIGSLDGDKFVCMDTIIRSKNCIIYSYGINNEWSFEDIMAADFNCSVYAYDHTIDAPALRGERIHFKAQGIGIDKTEQLDTLEAQMRANGHSQSTISFLKADIEGSELTALPQWIESGVLDRVEQLAFEFHTRQMFHLQPDQPSFKDVLKTIQDLYKKDFRLISYIPNLLSGKKDQEPLYYPLFEAVFMKNNLAF